MKPFLVLQARPETEAADDEYAAILRKGGLDAAQTRRVRLERMPTTDASRADGARLDAYAGVIVGGGPGCVSDPEREKSGAERRIEAALANVMPAILADDIPFLGCCYGLGVLAVHLGAPVAKGRYAERIGAIDCTLTGAGRDDPLLADLPARFRAFTGHKEAVQALPGGCAHLVESVGCPYQMIRFRENVYATQFHPEADADGFATRARVYRDAGYFPPEEADDLIAACRTEDVHVPERILRRFVERYRDR